jgi:hypothetical protein
MIHNMGMHTILQNILIDPANPGKGPTVCLNGSDGRGENCLSPLEPIIFIERFPQRINETQKEIRHRTDLVLKTMVDYARTPLDGSPATVFDGVIEIKSIEDGRLAYYHDPDGIPQDSWPGRIIDASPLHHDGPGLLTTGREKVYDEARSADGKKMIDREKQRLADFHKICRNGTQSRGDVTISHFNLDEGVAYYSNDPHRIVPRSFKYGPLRLMQGYLTSRILVSARRNTVPTQTLTRIPPNTKQKIAMLKDEGVLRINAEEAERLTDLYLYFLRLYHLSEYVHVMEQTHTVAIPNRAEAKELLSELLTRLDALRERDRKNA